MSVQYCVGYNNTIVLVFKDILIMSEQKANIQEFYHVWCFIILNEKNNLFDSMQLCHGVSELVH